MDRLGYRPELDGLRALAVAAVIGYHAAVPGFGGGGVGVIWFFVLSGFLITTLLLEERDQFGAIDVPKFFLRRALRLLPPLYLMLAVFAVISVVYTDIDHREFLSAGLYFANMHALVFGAAAAQPFFLHTWSLSLEEQFYLAWPFVIRRLTTIDLAVALGVVLVVGAFLARWLVDRDEAILSVPIYSFDGFVIGAFLAVGVRSGKVIGTFDRRGVLAAAVVVMVLDVIVTSAHNTALAPFRVLASELAVAALILHAVMHPEAVVGAMLRRRQLVYVGLLSYSLYLWHFPVFELFKEFRHPGMSAPVRHVLKYAISIGAAVATYHLLDRPMATVRARLRPRAGRELVTVTSS